MKSLASKLIKIQAEVGAVKKTKANPYFKSKYADINAMLEVVKPALTKNKVILSQPLTNIDGLPAIKTILMDSESGETLEDITPLPEYEDAQKAGSAITYFRRYCLQSILGLEAEDDDGNSASGKNTSSKTVHPKGDKKAYRQKAEEEHECKKCGAPAHRFYGISKTGKDYNMLQCDEDKEHVEFLPADEKEITEGMMLNF